MFTLLPLFHTLPLLQTHTRTRFSLMKLFFSPKVCDSVGWTVWQTWGAHSHTLMKKRAFHTRKTISQIRSTLKKDWDEKTESHIRYYLIRYRHISWLTFFKFLMKWGTIIPKNSRMNNSHLEQHNLGLWLLCCQCVSSDVRRCFMCLCTKA